MNALSHSHALCLFPRATLIHRLCVPTQTVGHTQCVTKYLERGYKVPPPSMHAALIANNEFIGMRRVGDQSTLTVAFSTPYHPTSDSIDHGSPSLNGILFKNVFQVHTFRELRDLDTLRMGLRRWQYRSDLNGTDTAWIEGIRPDEGTRHIWRALPFYSEVASMPIGTSTPQLLTVWTETLTAAIP